MSDLEDWYEYGGDDQPDYGEKYVCESEYSRPLYNAACRWTEICCIMTDAAFRECPVNMGHMTMI